MITKAKLKEQLEYFPEKFTINELIEKLVFMEKVEEGLEDSKNGNKITEDQLETKMKQWFK
jgi:Zn-dependent alcohol dehydrogenase